MSGQTFAIGSFSGTGSVPAGIVYRWTSLPNYFLAEASGASGAAARQLYVGAPVSFGGHTYHVTSIMQHVNSNDGNAVFAASSSHAGAVQTCIGSNTNMNVYWFD